MATPLTLEEIRAAARQLAGRVNLTRVHGLRSMELDAAIGPGTDVQLELELLQLTGTFKARAALLNVLALSADAHKRGVTAISAGNHVVAVAFAAAAVGATAKVVMISTANPLRVALGRCVCGGKRVVPIVCGSNIDEVSYARSIAGGG